MCLIFAACEPAPDGQNQATLQQELIVGAPMTLDARLIEKSNGKWQLACMGRFRNLGIGDSATYAAFATFFQEGAQTALLNGQVTSAVPIVTKSALGAELTMTHPSQGPAGSLTVRMVRGPVDPKRHHSCQVVIRRNGTEVMRAMGRPLKLVLKPSAVFAAGASAFLPSTAVSVGDLDGDGDLDVFTGALNQQTAPWLNDGTGLWTQQTLGTHATYAVALGDLDADGDLDAFQGNRGQGNRVWLNDGSGVFTGSGQSIGNHQTTSVALGDVDGDGDIDVVEGNGNQPNRVWRNNGSGVFSDSSQLLGNHATYAVALGDLDGDGDLDIFEGNVNQGNRVWRNNGSGVFTDSGQLLGSNATLAVALGDLDGDGDLDAFAGNFYDQSNRIWLNNGTGVFTGRVADACPSLPCALPEMRSTTAVALGDADGDGDLDAFVGNFEQATTEQSQVFLNNGAGYFNNSGQSLGPLRAAAFGDFDSDGDLDLFAGNGVGSVTLINQ